MANKTSITLTENELDRLEHIFNQQMYSYCGDTELCQFEVRLLNKLRRAKARLGYPYKKADVKDYLEQEDSIV